MQKNTSLKTVIKFLIEKFVKKSERVNTAEMNLRKNLFNLTYRRQKYIQSHVSGIMCTEIQVERTRNQVLMRKKQHCSRRRLSH